MLRLKTLSEKFLFLSYLFVSVLLFLYTYTQVDLNLTLSRSSIWQVIQKEFQNIGYYQRPLSTVMYIVLLIALFILYFITLWLVKHRRVSSQCIWASIGIVTIILIFSYPAFSYDMFNYTFTAKTVLVYHKNPYLVIPLQFTGIEPWTMFMRWTHLPSAYTPLWIFLTLPAYIAGFGFLLPVMWNIKVLVAGFYLSCIWLIGRILEKEENKHALLGIAVFAFNPLIIVESLISSHNDVAMMALSLLAFYLYLRKDVTLSYLILALSVAMKLMTIFLFPVAMLGWKRPFALIAMIIGFILVITQREVLPWYLVWVIPFVALMPARFDLIMIESAASLGLLLRYATYIYFGHWNDPVPSIKIWVTLLPICIAVCYILVRKTLIRRK